jgi:hypothetical protein
MIVTFVTFVTHGRILERPCASRPWRPGSPIRYAQDMKPRGPHPAQNESHRPRLSLVSSQDALPLGFQALQDSTDAEPPRALFGRALFEVDCLGPRPRRGPRWPWDDRRKQSLRRLAALADHDPYLLRRAAFVKTRPTRRDKAAANLLNDATYYAWRAPLSELTPPMS